LNEEDRLPCHVDEAVLADPGNEESASLDYYFHATAHLLNVLHADAKLRKSPLYEQVMALVQFWNADPSERNNTKAYDAAIDAHLFGTVGKALWYFRGKNDPQLRKELGRLATEEGALVGTHYLFYIAGTLAAKGFNVSFVPEQGTKGAKTPDLLAELDGRRIWVEANAKQPKRTVDTPEKIWQMIRDIIEEKSQKFTDAQYSPVKSQKFTDAQYSPGMIVADISTAYHLVNENGTAPFLKLREDLCRPLGHSLADGFVYRLYDDPAWEQQKENQGNVFAYLIDEFSRIDRSKRHVDQCLITITRQVLRDDKMLAFPKGHQLVVHRDAESQAMLELSKHVYVVDSKPVR